MQAEQEAAFVQVHTVLEAEARQVSTGPERQAARAARPTTGDGGAGDNGSGGSRWVQVRAV